MTALHDSRNPFYRTPSGARPAGEKLTLRLRAEAGAKAFLRLWWNDAEQKMPMKPSRVEEGLFEITLALPKTPGLLWYYFVIEAKDGVVQVAGKKLLADGKEIRTEKALNCAIG